MCAYGVISSEYPSSNLSLRLRARNLKVAFVVVQSLSWIWLSVTSWTTACQASLSSTVSWGLCNSCPLSWWCSLSISSSATLLSFCLQSSPASGSFLMSWLFTSGGQSIGALASATVLPMNIHGWFPLGLTDLVSLQSKGLLRVLSSTIIYKLQFFSTQPSLLGIEYNKLKLFYPLIKQFNFVLF